LSSITKKKKYLVWHGENCGFHGEQQNASEIKHSNDITKEGLPNKDEEAEDIP